eukprot:13637931-Ditylum_brightwellii.AAC.1
MKSAAAEGYDPIEVLKEIRITASDKGKRRRRNRCKSYGNIGFGALAKNIAEKWNGLDATAKAPFAAMAMEEKMLYNAKMIEWKKKKAEKLKYELDTTTLDQMSLTGMEQESKIQDRSNPLLSPYSVPFQESLQMKLAAETEGDLGIFDHSIMRMENTVLPFLSLKHDEVIEDMHQPSHNKQQQSIFSNSFQLMDMFDLEPTPLPPHYQHQHVVTSGVPDISFNKKYPATNLLL